MHPSRRREAALIVLSLLLGVAAGAAVATASRPAAIVAAPPPQLAGNSTTNNTCGPGSYCFTQLTLLWNSLFPWLGNTGATITFLAERVQLLTILVSALIVLAPCQVIGLFYYTRKKGEDVKKHKMGPQDPRNWELLWLLLELAVPEEKQAEFRERLKTIVEESARERIRRNVIRAKKAKPEGSG